MNKNDFETIAELSSVTGGTEQLHDPNGQWMHILDGDGKAAVRRMLFPAGPAVGFSRGVMGAAG